MEWEDTIEIINKAYEKEFENKAFSMWLTLYPNMDKKNFISFNDYKNQLTTPKVDNTLSSIDEVLNDVQEIRKMKARKEESINGNI